MVIRVRMRWADSAKECLKKLPKKVREGIVAKADELIDTDPRKANKPLHGPLSGMYSMKYSRYRAIYTVREEHITSGDVLLHLDVCFVHVGIRKEQDKKDIYEVAKKLIKLGALEKFLLKKD